VIRGSRCRRIGAVISRQFIQEFTGPQGRAELWENVGYDDEYPLLERVQYEVIHPTGRFIAFTLGEAAIVACDVVGDDRFSQPVMSTRNSPLMGGARAESRFRGGGTQDLSGR
jgi:hypothetical protein